MNLRTLGTQGLAVAPMGLGCMGMSEFYGVPDDAESIATIHRFLDRGFNFLDTADAYGPFRNEELVGRAIKGRRDSVVLATKFGIQRSENPAERRINGKPDYVRSAAEGSLKRLGVDHIDLYYLHRVDAETPVEDTVGAMADLVRAGKVRYLGLSEASPDTLRRAMQVHPISALQSEYSLWSREPEDGVLAACRELGIGFVAYSPLGRGFLTGHLRKFEDFAPDDYRRFTPRFQGENFQTNLNLVDRVAELAAARGCTAAQLALAWVLAQGPDTVPIPGTKRRTTLDNNLDAVGLQLSGEDLSRLAAALPKDAAAGPRYPEAMMKLVGR